MNVVDLFPDPQGDAAKRLRDLATRHGELKAEARGLRTQANDDNATRADLTAKLHAAQARQRAFGDAAKDVKAAQVGLAKLGKVASERADETRIVSDAAATVEGEITRHAREHAKDLWMELRVDAARVTEALTAAVEGVRAAHADYVKAATRAADLLRLTDLDAVRTVRIPDPPPALAEFIRHHDVGSSIQPPLPMQQATISAAELQRITAEAEAAA